MPCCLEQYGSLDELYPQQFEVDFVVCLAFILLKPARLLQESLYYIVDQKGTHSDRHVYFDHLG